MSVDRKAPKGYRKAWNGGKPPEEDAASLAFSAHIDTCRHCHDHPFDLCPEGNVLLTAAVASPPVPEVK